MVNVCDVTPVGTPLPLPVSAVYWPVWDFQTHARFSPSSRQYVRYDTRYSISIIICTPSILFLLVVHIQHKSINLTESPPKTQEPLEKRENDIHTYVAAKKGKSNKGLGSHGCMIEDKTPGQPINQNRSFFLFPKLQNHKTTAQRLVAGCIFFLATARQQRVLDCVHLKIGSYHDNPHQLVCWLLLTYNIICIIWYSEQCIIHS